MDDNLFSILDIQSLLRFAIQQTALQIEVVAGAVGINGSESRLDISGGTFDIGDITFVAQIVVVDILAGTGTLLVAHLEHRHANL